MHDGLSIVLLVVVGVVAGALNVVAGGGSFLTLPVLIFLGVPPGLANGTNRVAILIQNVGASWGFHRHGVLDTQSIFWAAAPATIGAAVGTQLALVMSDAAFQRVLSILMVVVTVWTLLVSPSSGDESKPKLRLGWLIGGFFVVGLYGGFVQAGVGFFILAATSLAGLDLVRGNAVKVLSILCFTVISLVMFALEGRVNWTLGLALGVGTLIGGQIGVHLTVLKGHRWVQRFVVVTVLLFAVLLWIREAPRGEEPSSAPTVAQRALQPVAQSSGPLLMPSCSPCF